MNIRITYKSILLIILLGFVRCADKPDDQPTAKSVGLVAYSDSEEEENFDVTDLTEIGQQTIGRINSDYPTHQSIQENKLQTELQKLQTEIKKLHTKLRQLQTELRKYYPGYLAPTTQQQEQHYGSPQTQPVIHEPEPLIEPEPYGEYQSESLQSEQVQYGHDGPKQYTQLQVPQEREQYYEPPTTQPQQEQYQYYVSPQPQLQDQAQQYGTMDQSYQYYAPPPIRRPIPCYPEVAYQSYYFPRYPPYIPPQVTEPQQTEHYYVPPQTQQPSPQPDTEYATPPQELSQEVTPIQPPSIDQSDSTVKSGHKQGSVKRKKPSRKTHKIELYKKDAGGNLVEMSDNDYFITHMDVDKGKYLFNSNLEQIRSEGEIVYEHLSGTPYCSVLKHRRRYNIFILTNPEGFILVKKVEGVWRKFPKSIPDFLKLYTQDSEGSEILLTEGIRIFTFGLSLLSILVLSLSELSMLLLIL
uniref:Theileria-specific sub-telomeric protein, SVSP family member n=1 Tax=Theileria parva TaxID=5875 RepID=Q4N9U3_THEPA|eukprot:XP_765531.1 hypothetical protein [Theileria parva strain Muguga]